MLILVPLAGCLIDRDLYEDKKADLADGDGDAFVFADDCDDGDPGVHPGADEVCDGVDQDCDGDVDDDAVDAPLWYADADGDGFGDVAAGTASCEAPEGTAANSLDCDDGSSTVNPDAAETACDGVDDDCDGADLEDADGDGYTCAAAGGSDCDDGSDAVHPGEVETWADGFTDNDCDGEIGAATLEFGAEAWSGWRAGDYQGRRVAALGDLDGDGLADVLIGSEYDSTLGSSSGAVYAVDGAPSGSLEGARSLLPDEAGRSFASELDAGVDATEDGVPDLLVSAVGTETEVGTAWLVDGASWATRGDASVGQVAVSSVTGSAPGTYGPSGVRFVGDVTGDGVTDIALSECCGTSAGTSSLGRVAIFSADDFEGSIEDADVLLEGSWDHGYVGGRMDPVGDQDGDGLDDILLGAAGGVAAVVIGGSTSGAMADLAIAVVYGEVSSGYVQARDAGDLDGDGKDDVALLGEDDAGRIPFFTALGAAPSRVIDAPTCTLDWTEHGGVVDIVPLGDRDGDGRGELFVPEWYSDSGNQRAWIVPGSAVVYGTTIQAEALPVSAISVVPAAGFGYRAALAGDVDGDGTDDIVVGAPDYSGAADGAGGATLLPVPG